jgi:biopolymer transport protein ExbB
MVALAITALAIFSLGIHVLLQLWEKGHRSMKEETLQLWLAHSEKRRGPIGALLDFVAGAKSIKGVSVCFDELRTTEIVPFQRDLRVMKICVSAAPLLGLLGTVTGMLSTFGALASGSGGEKTMGLVAEGISEALITTETGLIIALPGLFFQYLLTRNLERYRGFLAHLETMTTQFVYRSGRPSAQEEAA